MIRSGRRLYVVTVAALLTVSIPVFGQNGVPQSRASGGRPVSLGTNVSAGRWAVSPQAVPQPNENAKAPAGSKVEPNRASAGEVIAGRPRLAAQIAEMLGVDVLTSEPNGFSDAALFVATVRASNNVEGATFEGLKARLIGDEETGPVALREAIQVEAALTEAQASVVAEEAIQEANNLVGLDTIWGTPAQGRITSRVGAGCPDDEADDLPPGSCRNALDSGSDKGVREAQP